jgi:hypothetical protein
MCNLLRKTRKKTATVYKVVFKNKNTYYSYYAGTRIRLGEVKKQDKKDYKNLYRFGNKVMIYQPGLLIFNEIMIGKCSGFARLRTAKRLIERRTNESIRILKIELGGEIWYGNSFSIIRTINSDEAVFAGTEILEFKEI